MESFWSTEYGQDLMSMESTAIDRLLSSPDTILEDLMDDDELLQQCSNKNGSLIAFLSREENITKLISYITRPWQEHMTRIVQHLEEQEARQNVAGPDATTHGDGDAPLSAHSLHSMSSIAEQPEPGGDGDALNDPESLMALQEDEAATPNVN